MVLFIMGIWNPGGLGHFLLMKFWGCAAGWGHISMNQLTIMGNPFQAFSIKLLEWGRTFLGLWELENYLPKSGKDGGL